MPNCRRFSDLLSGDLSASDAYDTLHPGDVEFYTKMWADLTAYLTREIRRRDPKGLIFSYNFTRVTRWPDPWMEAMLRGVEPYVDGFAAELYADNAYREIVDDTGRITERPTLIRIHLRRAGGQRCGGSGRLREHVAVSLLASPWFRA